MDKNKLDEILQAVHDLDDQILRIQIALGLDD